MERDRDGLNTGGRHAGPFDVDKPGRNLLFLGPGDVDAVDNHIELPWEVPPFEGDVSQVEVLDRQSNQRATAVSPGAGNILEFERDPARGDGSELKSPTGHPDPCKIRLDTIYGGVDPGPLQSDVPHDHARRQELPFELGHVKVESVCRHGVLDPPDGRSSNRLAGEDVPCDQSEKEDEREALSENMVFWSFRTADGKEMLLHATDAARKLSKSLYEKAMRHEGGEA